MAAFELNPALRLDELLQGLAPAPALAISDITCDSRAVKAGALFIATRGLTRHGVDFVPDAIARGAVAVVYDASTAELADGDCAVPCIGVPGLAAELGEIANRFFARPSDGLSVIGVTGTNGKSTVAWLIAQSLNLLGSRCAYSGTLGYGIGALEIDNDMTSPDVIELHRRLARFRDQAAEFAAIEVSSHALDQGRVSGTRFEAAIFTNLSRDHLDYHGDMQAYASAKERLFVAYPVAHSIINIDTEFGASLATRGTANTWLVSTTSDCSNQGQSFVFAESIGADERGSLVRVNTSLGEASFHLPLPGRFNVANALSALAFLLAEGRTLDESVAVLAGLSAPPGRMQRVTAAAGPTVYVDYAHTPDALNVALTALREHCRGKLWCVFGCGGDRDAGKRPQMGLLAAALADRVLVTNDNPRSESPTAIISDIVRDLDVSTYEILEDRAAAIAWSIAEAGDEDVMLIAGKGHENYQIIGAERRDFSDFDVAATCLAARELRT
jgi:UDP-N-acetylmuramoyl-L-alanyl-D-glutamate--2,6-diaminopimelate ligase